MAIREEIISGLKNATTRGESLEKATASFVNAGYNAPEVQQAAATLRSQGDLGVTGKLHPAHTNVQPVKIQEPPKEKKPGFFSKLFKKKQKPSQLIQPKPKSITPQQKSLLVNEKPKHPKSLLKIVILVMFQYIYYYLFYFQFFRLVIRRYI